MSLKPTIEIIKIESKEGFIKIGKNADGQITLVGFSGSVDRNLKQKINENIHLLLSKESPIVKTNQQIIDTIKSIDTMEISNPIEKPTYTVVDKATINLKE